MQLLQALNDPRAAERPAAVTVAGRSLDTAGLVGAAGAVAARVAGAPAVAVEATASLETVVAVVGALAAGVPVVHVPPDAGPVERSHILRDCAAPILLTAEREERLPSPGPEVVRVDVAERRHLPPPRLAPPAGAGGGRPAMIVYTSGTTGVPKGVMLSGAAIAADLDALAAAWAWGPEDVVVHGLPLFHVHGLILGVLGALRAGGRVVHTGRPTPAGYAAAVAGGGTMVFGVPTVWGRVAADPGAASVLRGARLLVSGSAALPPPVFEALAALAGHAPVERYGMTETLITLSARAGGACRPGWVGCPLAGVEARVLGDDRRPVSPDGETVGDLEVRGATLMSGYLNRPDATASMFSSDGWLRTGDVACVGEGGWYRIVGRRDTDLIKCGGYRVGAGEVEGALLAHPAVSEAAVVGEPDDDLGQAIVAYVVASGVTGPELAEFVAATLSVHKRPRRVHMVAALPRNALGKVQKQHLR